MNKFDTNQQVDEFVRDDETLSEREQQRQELRLCLMEVLQKEGREPEEIVSALNRFDRDCEISDIIEANGLRINSRKHLLKMTNIQMRAGRLHDGILHYQWQVVVKGSTYNLKDDLKSLGFRWDGTEKVWYRPITEGSIADALLAARNEVVSIFE